VLMITDKIMIITNACINTGGIEVAISENGFVSSIST